MNTQTTQHTPGPWRVGSPTSEHKREYIPVIGHIKIGPKAKLDWEACRAGSYEDARLIAAAPELLEALRKAEDYLRIYSQDPNSLARTNIINLMEAAIAKATGLESKSL